MSLLDGDRGAVRVGLRHVFLGGVERQQVVVDRLEVGIAVVALLPRLRCDDLVQVRPDEGGEVCEQRHVVLGVPEAEGPHREVDEHVEVVIEVEREFDAAHEQSDVAGAVEEPLGQVRLGLRAGVGGVVLTQQRGVV